MTYKTAIFLASFLVSAVGCGDKDNYLEGSLSDQYNLDFDSVQVTQYIGARQLLIEYLAARGVCPDDPPTFGEACLISGEPTTGRSISVTQLRKDLGLD